MQHLTWTHGEYRLTTDPAAMDLAAITQYVIRESYWGTHSTPELLKRGLEHSFNFHLLHGAAQVGLARVITDFATFGYLSDVYVRPEHAGRGLGKWMMKIVIEHPELQNFRRWLLLTRDAHGLYEKFGFAAPLKPETLMELPGSSLLRGKK